MLRIDSEHSGDPVFKGEANRLRVALVESKRASDSCVLYRVVGTLYNPKAGEAMHYKDPGPELAASCVTTADETILVLNYATGFLDTFCFRGWRLNKTGALQEKNSIIHWTERLRLQRLSKQGDWSNGEQALQKSRHRSLPAETRHRLAPDPARLLYPEFLGAGVPRPSRSTREGLTFSPADYQGCPK